MFGKRIVPDEERKVAFTQLSKKDDPHHRSMSGSSYIKAQTNSLFMEESEDADFLQLTDLLDMEPEHLEASMEKIDLPSFDSFHFESQFSATDNGF